MIHNAHCRRAGAPGGDSSCQAVEAFYNQWRGHSTLGRIGLSEEDGAATARAGSCRLYLERRQVVATLAALF